VNNSFFPFSPFPQPRVEKGHKADENHVSKTSGSWENDVEAHLGQSLGSSSKEAHS